MLSRTVDSRDILSTIVWTHRWRKIQARAYVWNRSFFRFRVDEGNGIKMWCRRIISMLSTLCMIPANYHTQLYTWIWFLCTIRAHRTLWTKSAKLILEALPGKNKIIELWKIRIWWEYFVRVINLLLVLNWLFILINEGSRVKVILYRDFFLWNNRMVKCKEYAGKYFWLIVYHLERRNH